MSFRKLLAAACLSVSSLVVACAGEETELPQSTSASTEVGIATSALSSTIACPAHPSKVENGKLLVWDDATQAYGEFFVKGMAYSPEASSFVDGATSGPAGSLCRGSDNLGTPSGAFYLPGCFDSDYAGNLVSLDRSRTVNRDFRAAWLRDMKIMKDMGVNTIRLYNANPQFRDHKSFLDDAQANGMKVMFPAWYIPDNAGYDWPFGKNEVDGYKLPIQKGVELQLAEVAAHPAVIMWTVGNELVDGTDYQNPSALGKFRLGRIAGIMDQIKSECGGSLLVTNIPQDLGDHPAHWSHYADALPKMDLFVVNSGYRGDPNGSNSYDRLWPLVKGITTTHHKPFVLGETGEYDHQKYGNQWFEGLVSQMHAPAQADAGIVGATFFEYSDEPRAKTNFGKNPANQEQHMGVVQLTADPSNKALDRASVRPERFDMIRRAFAR